MTTSRGPGIVLIGLMGAGKSTVGRALADHLNVPFCDLDDEIVRMAGRSIPEIFALEGEEGFRDRESAALACLAPQRRCVLATGGGTPIRPRNWALLRALGRIVWLDIDPELAAARAAGGDRPLLGGIDPVEKMRQLHAVRAPVYARADQRVDATLPVAEIVATILERN